MHLRPGVDVTELIASSDRGRPVSADAQGSAEGVPGVGRRLSWGLASVVETSTVAEWMTAHPTTVDMDTSLGAIRHLMTEHGFHHVLVTEAGRVVGVISDRDVLRSLSPRADKERLATASDLATLNKRAHQIMSRTLISVRPSSSMPEAAALMLQHHINCLPVIDGTRCHGMLTAADLLRWTVAVTTCPAAS